MIKINMPRAESVANECTLVKIPDRTKKVPKILSEKHNIDKKTIHLISNFSFFVIINE